MTALSSLGRWLRQRREILGLTQQQLAQRAKCSYSLIRKLESGQRPMSRAVAQHLAEALQIPLSQRAIFLDHAANMRAFAPDRPPWESAAPQHSLYPGRLPTPPNALYGRDEDVARVCDRLRDPATRALTLVGPPGVGKTRLAIAAAYELAPVYPHAVCFVDLASLNDHRLVPGAIAHALGLNEQAGHTLQDALANYLHHRSMLLLLDNYEHVLDARGVVAYIVQHCPQVQALITSREPLRLRAERRLTIHPLAARAATALFIDRVQAVHPAYTQTNADLLIVNAICDRLDRLPLALELAAARADVYSLAALLAELERPLDVLTDGLYDLPERQRMLRATIGWSYDRLDPPTQAIFRHLGIFRGGATSEALAAICGEEQKAISMHLMALTGKSLLIQNHAGTGEPRYVMLEMLREYAMDQLKQHSEEERAQQTHAAYFLDLTERAEPELHGVRQNECLDRIEAEIDNIRSALTWALFHDDAVDLALRLSSGLHKYWYIRGSIPEGGRWIEQAIAHAKRLRAAGVAIPARSLAKALQYAGYMEFSGYHRLPVARAWYEESLAIYDAIDDPEGQATALTGLGLVARREGRLAEARMLHQQALTIYESIGYQYGIARSIVSLALVTLDEGHPAGAATELSAGLAMYRVIGDANRIANTLSLLAIALEEQGNYAAAITALEESRALSIAQSDAKGQAECLVSLGRIFALQGRREAAIRSLGEAFTFYAQRIGADMMLEIPLILAWAEQKTGRYDAAARLLAVTQRTIERSRKKPPLLMQHDIERTITELRAILGDTAFEHAWREGINLTIEEAVDSLVREVSVAMGDGN